MDDPDHKRDFFVSFNKADRNWATWIAWVLEEAGHSVWFQDWDFRGNFVEHMDRAQRQADRPIAVLSDHYFGSDFTLVEWSFRFAQDPAMREDRLVPVKVGSLTDRGILTPIVYADLTEADEGEAQRRLLERVKKALDASYRPKPLTRPGFPGSPAREVPSKPQFPPVQAHLGGSRERDSMAENVFHNTGDFRGAAVFQGSTIHNAGQIAGTIHNADAGSRDELKALLQQLADALKQVPPDKV